jgi:hypothetical protein
MQGPTMKREMTVGKNEKRLPGISNLSRTIRTELAEKNKQQLKATADVV